jgi:hypothetical protein
MANGLELKMRKEINRREFLETAAACSALYLGGSNILASSVNPEKSRLISPGCRKTKVKVARLYMAIPNNFYWPKPSLNLKDELKVYDSEFKKLKGELSDVEFPVDEFITFPEQVNKLKNVLQYMDGILAIQITPGIDTILNEILSISKPTVVFAIPYSGFEWENFGSLQKQSLGAKMECLLTSDYKQLAFAIKPFRAIHHLREAKILNLTTRNFTKYADDMKNKFGTDIKQITLEQVANAYNAVSDNDAKAETDIWVKRAEKVVEPSMEDIFKSCKLALAFERMLDQEDATIMTADCYGTMWDKTIKLPAYPCLGFVRLNNIGLGGICESDLQGAMTHVIFQGLSGKPSFIGDPIVDESKNSIIMAHCMGATKMDGPDNPAAPYKLRNIMERQEGIVPQVQMRVGQKVTEGILLGTDIFLYFTGEIIETPVGLEVDRGCRTKITVKVDGDVRKLWKNWMSESHRLTCYGDITRELEFFCRFKEIKMVNEVT